MGFWKMCGVCCFLVGERKLSWGIFPWGLLEGAAVFAKTTKSTIIICMPGNTPVHSKVSHESYLHMETTYKVRIMISSRPELIGGNVLKTCLSHSHTWTVTTKTKTTICLFSKDFSFVGKVDSLNHNSR